MICFKDQAFCSSSNQCGNKACPLNLTPELVEQGKKWWKCDDFPVAMADFKEGCPDFLEIENEEEKTKES